MTDQYLVWVCYNNRETGANEFNEQFYCTEDGPNGLLQTLYRIRYLRQHEGHNYSPHSHDVRISIDRINSGFRPA